MILTGDAEVPGTKPVPVSLCAPKVPQELAWEKTRASALEVGGPECCKSKISSHLPVMLWRNTQILL